MESEGSEYARGGEKRADRKRVGQKRGGSRRENGSVQSEGCYCRLRGVRAGCTQQWY